MPLKSAGDKLVILVSINFLPMPDAVKHDIMADDVKADPIRPNLEAPLAYTFAFELLDFRGWAKWVDAKTLDCFQDLLLELAGEIFKVALEARGEENNKTSWHSQ